MVKNYFLDTNILLQSPNIIMGLDDNNVLITEITLEELDKHKNDKNEVGYNAREAIRNIDRLREGKGNFTDGYKTPMGGKFIIMNKASIRIASKVICKYKNLPAEWDKDKPDNIILECVLEFAKYNENTILITNDIIMSIKAETLGLDIQRYKNDMVDTEEEYTGRQEVNMITEEDFKSLDKGIPVPVKATDISEEDIVENKFLFIHRKDDMLLGWIKGRDIVPLKPITEKSAYGVRPRNAAQVCVLNALLAPVEQIPLVILKGPAGTSKTFLSMAAGLQGVYHDGYNKLLITRNNVNFGDEKDIGALPGDEMQKMSPVMRGCLDNLENLLRNNDVPDEDIDMYITDMLESGIVKIESLAYMRGRSLTNTFLIIDEAQNTTVKQMLGIITRIGSGTKIVITGDNSQIDRSDLTKHSTGLSVACERLKGMNGEGKVAIFQYNNDECIRSEIARIASEKLDVF